MRNTLLLTLLLSFITFTSFENKTLTNKPFCGPGINIVNNTSALTITGLSVVDPFVVDARSVNIGPGQSLYLGQYGGPTFHVKLLYSGPLIGSVTVASGSTIYLCKNDDAITNVSFTTTHCGTYDVIGYDDFCP